MSNILLHRGTGPQHLFKALSLRHRPPQAADLLAQRAGSDGPIQCEFQRLHLHRLGDEVVRARANRADRALQAAEGRDDDDRKVGPLARERPAEVESAPEPQVQIRQDRIDGALGQLRAGFLDGGGPLDAEVQPGQAVLQQLAELRLVVDDENLATHGSSLLPFQAPGPWAASSAAGRFTRNRLPRPGWLATSIQPPCSRTIP